MSITARLRRYTEVNEEIKNTLLSKKRVVLNDVNGQRYIGCALDKGKTIEIHGTAGNDLACFLNGGKIVLYGHGQDAVGNTMNGGELIIHGHTGDALGYGMRDGQIYIRDNVCCRSGIHMKEFREMKPVLVIGQNAGSFLGEYMAGGTIILLGLDLKKGESLFGTHCASGMHGGKIILRGDFKKENIAPNIKIERLNAEDIAELKKHVKKYCSYFNRDYDEIMSKPFRKLLPKSSRPYANMYVAN